MVNARGIRTDYTYNSAHKVTSIRRAVTTPDESLTQYTYTAWGGVASVIDPLNHTTSYTYTARRQILTVTPPAGGTTSYGYNSVDDQVTMTNGNGRTWTTAYDASRLVTSVTDPQNHMIRHEYDNNGNRVRTYDGKNQLTTFNYDSRDRLTSIVDPLNGATAYQYDAVGNLTRITNARNSQTNFIYDNANRLTQVRDALNQTTTYGYDASSNRTSMQDRKGTNHAYTYDQANRLTQVSAGGTTISYTYSATGQRLTMVDPTGTTGYLYDNLDRLTRTTYPDGRTVQLAYDAAGNRTNLTYPGGTVSQSYTYDAANRLTRITQGTLQWNFSYDGAGNRTQLTQPNGTSTIYTYLVNNWLQSIDHRAPGGATLQAFTYTYDANGNRLTQTDATGVTSFTYDGLDRLTQAIYPAGYGTWTWSYDAVGNRTQQVAPGGTTGYTYDANNRLTQAANVVYTYDANGNLTGTSAGRTFTYNPFNQMTQATGPGGTVTHTYNGDGLKTRRVGPDGTTKYYYDGIRPIWETDGGGAMTAQLDRDLFGNLLSRKEPTARRYYHFDGLGSTTGLTNESGTVVATMLYDAWGLQRTSGGSGHGKYRFTGAEFDSATGLYHMGARFYDPSLGRWLSEDPVQDKPFEPATLNLYAYVFGNPLGYTDLDGQIAWAVVGGVVGFAVGVAAYALSHRGSMILGGALTWGAGGALIGVTLGVGSQVAAAAFASQLATSAAAVGAEIAKRNGNPAATIGTVLSRNGQVIAWLEQGTAKSGFQHIVNKHLSHFIGRFGNLTLEQLKVAVLDAAARLGGPGARRVQITINGITDWVRVVIGSNGYIETVFPD